MCRALLALLLTLAAASAPARDAVSALDGCLARLDPALDVGYEKVAARCPDLTLTLAQSPWAAWLPRGWDQAGNNLSAGGLRELRALIVEESRRGPGARVPQASHVAAVLAALSPGERLPGGWWERFKGWLREMLSAREPPGGPNWLSRMVDALRSRASLVKVVALVALGLVALLAGAIVVGGLRSGGAWRAGARGGLARSAAAVSAAGWRQVEASPPAERPRLLLELIAARLAALERLPPPRALTVRELARAAHLADAADRARLDGLGDACERLRFSGRQLPPEALAEVLAGGRELLDALEAAPA